MRTYQKITEAWRSKTRKYDQIMFQRLIAFYVIQGNDERSSGYDKILNFLFKLTIITNFIRSSVLEIWIDLEFKLLV